MIIYDSYMFKRLTDSELIKFIPDVSDFYLDSFCCEYYLHEKKIAMCMIYDLDKDVELNKIFLNIPMLN